MPSALIRFGARHSGHLEDSLSPELREAVARLAAERNRLRDELARARGRIASLERLAG